MKSKHHLYGLLGLLSLLGFIGVFTEDKVFLTFFAFAVEFQYFFIKPDEMLEQYMNKSAARGFFCGMITTAVIAVLMFFVAGQSGEKAFLIGVCLGWAVSIVVYALSSAYYGFKETWGLEHD